MESVHNFFGLSYAQYLAIPRSVLQSMPEEWQDKFVECLLELSDTIDYGPTNLDDIYRVQLFRTNPGGEEDHEYWLEAIDDPLADYERGRRRVPFRGPSNGV